MKNLSLMIIALLVATISFTSCGSENEKAEVKTEMKAEAKPKAQPVVAEKKVEVKKEEAPKNVYMVVPNGLNLREKASGSSKILGVLEQNETVEVLKEEGAWAQIKTKPGQTGYVAKKYLDKI